MLETIVDEAGRQAADLLELDAARAEAWASDLLALAAEAEPAGGPAAVVAALAATGTPATAAALHAVAALVPELVPDGPPAPAPRWAEALGTATCDGAWILTAGVGRSVVFRFVDAFDDVHVLTVDLVDAAPGEGESVGEVVVGPGELLDAVEESDAGIEREEVEPGLLAARVADALAATSHAAPTAVANGRLLAARLSGLVDGAVPVLALDDDDVPDPPEHDADDDRYAAEVLRRAVGELPAADPGDLAVAGAALRAAVRDEAGVARWLAAAPDADPDAPDREIVVAALAAPVAPATLAPLTPPQRDAVVVLEWADWLGAVIGAVRIGAGADVSPDALVDLVNRCPEVTTTIPKADRARVAWAFSVCTAPWAELSVTVDHRLTAFGAAVLPSALLRAWIGDDPA